MGTRHQIATFDYETIRGDALNILVRYAPGKVAYDWATDDEVEVVVRNPTDDTEISIPSNRVTLVDSTSAPGDGDANILTSFLPSETDQLPDDVPCPFQVRLVHNTDDKRTILAGMITVRYSAVEGA